MTLVTESPRYDQQHFVLYRPITDWAQGLGAKFVQKPITNWARGFGAKFVPWKDYLPVKPPPFALAAPQAGMSMSGV